MKEFREQTKQGEEVGKWPVTPYTVLVRNIGSKKLHSYLRVDGTHIESRSILPGEHFKYEGFRGETERREFLFSLPRFARDESDRVSNARRSELGTITVAIRQPTGALVDCQPHGSTTFEQVCALVLGKINQNSGQQEGYPAQRIARGCCVWHHCHGPFTWQVR